MRITALLTSLAVALSGCATTPSSFQQNRYTISDERLCRTLASATEKRDQAFIDTVADEVVRRGLSATQCETLVNKQNLGIGVAVFVGVVLLAIVRAMARSGGGGGGTADYGWDWDLQRNAFGQPVWVCRGIQTGQYADLWRCNGAARTDFRWPG